MRGHIFFSFFHFNQFHYVDFSAFMIHDSCCLGFSMRKTTWSNCYFFLESTWSNWLYNVHGFFSLFRNFHSLITCSLMMRWTDGNKKIKHVLNSLHSIKFFLPYLSSSNIEIFGLFFSILCGGTCTQIQMIHAFHWRDCITSAQIQWTRDNFIFETSHNNLLSISNMLRAEKGWTPVTHIRREFPF